MKIILSRKGFDSQYGGMPSPVFDRGEMLPLPVPSNDMDKFEDFRFRGKTYMEIIRSLKPDLKLLKNCHMDPEIRRDAGRRPAGWVPALGQCGAAERHLRKQGVSAGDLFLFFGWFQHARWNRGKPEFVNDKYGFHAVYGYLQTGSMVNIADGEKVKPGHRNHPHVKGRKRYKNSNMLYVAAKKLSFDSSLPGAGVLKFHDGLVLTKKDSPKTHWNLPECFKGISYHNSSSWKKGYFKSADKGQEFVVEVNGGIGKWVKKVLDK